MTTYLINVYTKQIAIDYDEINSLIILDKRRKFKLKKEQAYMLDCMESFYQSNMTYFAWDMIEFFLKTTIENKYKHA